MSYKKKNKTKIQCISCWLIQTQLMDLTHSAQPIKWKCKRNWCYFIISLRLHTALKIFKNLYLIKKLTASSANTFNPVCVSIKNIVKRGKRGRMIQWNGINYFFEMGEQNMKFISQFVPKPTSVHTPLKNSFHPLYVSKDTFSVFVPFLIYPYFSRFLSEQWLTNYQ